MHTFKPKTYNLFNIMKKTTLLFAFVFTSLTFGAMAQDDKGIFSQSLPDVALKNLEDETIHTGKIENDGNPIVIAFWATWCTPCKNELNTIDELYADWQEETGVKLIAVSTDDQRTAGRVVPYVDSRSWEFEILLDPNGDFKRAMGVNNIPHTFLIDGNGKIVYSHNNYAPGDEYALYDKILELMEEK